MRDYHWCGTMYHVKKEIDLAFESQVAYTYQAKLAGAFYNSLTLKSIAAPTLSPQRIMAT